MTHVMGMSRGSRQLVMGKFQDSKPLRHVEMVWKNPLTSQQQDCLRRLTEFGNEHDTTRQMDFGTSLTCHGEKG